MHQTILVPVDFRVESLNTAKFAIEFSQAPQVRLVLFYAQLLDNSISDLLFYTPSKLIKALETDEFKEALAILHNKFEHKISGIGIKLFHGTHQNAFSNFLEANTIDQIFIPETYKLKLTGRAFDPVPLIERSGIPVHRIRWEEQHNSSEKDHLEALFNHHWLTPAISNDRM